MYVRYRMTDMFKYILYRISDMVYTGVKGGIVIMESCAYGSCCAPEGRRFLTKGEKIEMLEEYKQHLDAESKGVAERIAALAKDSE